MAVTIGFSVGDKLRLKKEHACGGKDWEVVALGADVKIKCLTCGRFLSLLRSELAKKVKSVERKENGLENCGKRS